MLTDGNPGIELNDTYTCINRKYEIDVNETKVTLRRGSVIIIQERKWTCSDTFYHVMSSIYNKIKELKLLPMFTQIKMKGEKIEDIKIIINILKEIYKTMYI